MYLCMQIQSRFLEHMIEHVQASECLPIKEGVHNMADHDRGERLFGAPEACRRLPSAIAQSCVLLLHATLLVQLPLPQLHRVSI